MMTRYNGNKKPSYYCGEYWRLAMDVPCGHIAAATLDDLVAKEVLCALEPASLELSLRLSKTWKKIANACMTSGVKRWKAAT